MSEREKKEIQEMVETAQMLAEHDPQSLLIAKSDVRLFYERNFKNARTESR